MSTEVSMDAMITVELLTNIGNIGHRKRWGGANMRRQYFERGHCPLPTFWTQELSFT